MSRNPYEPKGLPGLRPRTQDQRIDRLTERVRRLESLTHTLLDNASQASIQVEQLRADLERFGTHTTKCAYAHGGDRCNCGFTRATQCAVTGCTNKATHTWSGHPTCDDCGTPKT